MATNSQSLFIWECSFRNGSLIDGVFFFFHYFVSFLCLLASIVSDEKPAFNYIVPMDMMSHFALATFKIFFFDFQVFDYDISRCLSKIGFIKLLGFSRLMLYIRLRKLLAIISSNNFQPFSLPLLLLGFPLPISLYASHCTTCFWSAVHFFFQSSFLCSSDKIISIDLCSTSLTHFSVISNLLSPSF